MYSDPLELKTIYCYNRGANGPQDQMLEFGNNYLPLYMQLKLLAEHKVLQTDP